MTKLGNRLLLIESPTGPALAAACVARVFGWDVRYVRPAQPPSGISGLFRRLFRIRHLPSAAVKTGYDFFGYYDDLYDRVESILARDEIAPLMQAAARSLDGGEEVAEKIRICAWRRLREELRGCRELDWVAQNIRGTAKVRTLPAPTGVVSALGRTIDPAGRISRLYGIARLLAALPPREMILSLMLGIFSHAARPARRHIEAGHGYSDGTALPRKAMVILHSGLKYGDLFERDYFFSEDRTHPLHRDNVVYGCYDGSTDGGKRAYDLAASPGRVQALRCFAAETRAIRIAGKDRTAYLTNLVAKITASVSGYRQSLADAEPVSVAIISYDVQCPTEISVAAQLLGIRCIAIQERVNTVFSKIYPLVLDDYCVAGPAVSDFISRLSNMDIRNLHATGPIRRDWLHPRDRAASHRQYRPRVAVLDAYSAEWHEAADVIAVNSLENNRIFLEAILNLAARLPNVDFVIRGKDANWLRFSYFADLIERVNTAPNVSVHQDYSAMQLSYRIVEEADLVICRHTSLGEEALAAGIPCLFFERTVHGARWMSGLCDYGGFPVYVDTDDELNQRVMSFFEGSPVFDAPALADFRSDFFSEGRDDGTATDRVTELFDEILFDKPAEPASSGAVAASL